MTPTTRQSTSPRRRVRPTAVAASVPAPSPNRRSATVWPSTQTRTPSVTSSLSNMPPASTCHDRMRTKSGVVPMTWVAARRAPADTEVICRAIGAEPVTASTWLDTKRPSAGVNIRVEPASSVVPTPAVTVNVPVPSASNCATTERRAPEAKLTIATNAPTPIAKPRRVSADRSGWRPSDRIASRAMASAFTTTPACRRGPRRGDSRCRRRARRG